MGWLIFVFALLAGALIVNYPVGVIAIVVVTTARRVPLPSAQQISEAPWWSWMGGLCGAFYGLTAILPASRVGAATLTALFVR